jgi:hypothetical protein
MIHDWLQDINNTNKKLIFELWAHGNLDWSAEFGNDTRTKEVFEQLFIIDDPRLTVTISSCYSSAKIQTKKTPPQNTILYTDWWNQISTINSTKVFLEAYTKKENNIYAQWDRNQDGDVSWAEAKVYEMIYYSDSITPFFWQKDTNNRIRLAIHQNNTTSEQT